MKIPYTLQILYLQYKHTKPAPVDQTYNYNYNNGIFIAILCLLLIIVSFALTTSPFLLLLFILWLSLTQVLAFISSVNYLKRYTKPILESFIYFLFITGLLKVFFYIYQFLFSCLTYRGFKVFMIFITCGYFFYLIAARYVFTYKLSQVPLPFSFILLYFFASLLLFFRFLVNFSIFIIPYILVHHPDYIEILLTGIPEFDDIPNKPTPPMQSNPHIQNRSLFSFQQHRHIYRFPPQMPNSNLVRNIGIGCGIGTVVIGGIACGVYYQTLLESRRMADAAVITADAAIKSADAAVKSADAAAKQAGLISTQEYYKRHPEDLSK